MVFRGRPHSPPGAPCPCLRSPLGSGFFPQWTESRLPAYGGVSIRVTMQIYFSNRHVALRDALLADLSACPADPFEPWHLIVPGTALRRRLELDIADRCGICANVRFAYLGQWLWALMGKLIDLPACSPFDPQRLLWHLYALLHEPARRMGEDRLALYLGRADALMQYELAERLAGLYDQYLTYRPDWLRRWAEGGTAETGFDAAARADEGWQAALWRELLERLEIGAEHPAERFFATLEAMAPDDPGTLGLPRRAYLYALPDIPPLYLSILGRLARWVDLRLYLFSPCREYWGDVVDARRLARLEAAGRAGHHAVGHPLLAAWGKQAQAQLELLLEHAGEAADLDDAGYRPAAGGRLLATVQNGILDLRPPSGVPLDAKDDSIRFNSCHGLLRQLEVLHDQLLALFAADPGLPPAEVLVVTPDLAQAAPLIDAVFGAAPPGRQIPYAITGRPASQENPVARVLLKLLELPRSRLRASEVHDLLREEPVARRFGLDDADLERIHQWMQASDSRFGLDAAHRESLDLPAGERHTLAEGLTRLLLGYALPDDGAPLIGGHLPCASAEGIEAAALGGYWRYVEALRQSREELAEPRPAERWRQPLLALLERFVATGREQVEALQTVRSSLCALLESMAAAGAAPVPVEVLRAAVERALDEPARGGVPTGRVTFAPISAMRGLPYGLICAVGLDDGAFPRSDRPLECSLLPAAPRLGDRQRRLDDRNLFLDLLLAARERLWLYYTGRGIRDNAPRPPSVLVTELLEHLLDTIAGDDPHARAAARDRLVLEHPLQPFARRYFDGSDPRLYTFESEYAVQGPGPMGGALLADDEEERLIEPRAPFLSAPLPPPGPEWRTVELERLLRFFRNPSRFLLRERLGIELVEGAAELADDEPFNLDFEGRSRLRDRLLPALLEGTEARGLMPRMQAGGELPDGMLGEVLGRRELARLDGFAAKVRQALADAAPEPRSLHLELEVHGEPWILSGSLRYLTPAGPVGYRCDAARAGDHLTAWITHLVWCAAAGGGESRWIAEDRELRFRPVESPLDRLGELLALYRQGLMCPLRFYPKSAWDYARAEPDQAPRAARKKWQEGDFPEGADPWYRLALRGVDEPLDAEFEALARQVYGPLLAHLALG